MKILITGGAGYIGTELIRFFCKSADVKKIVCYDNFSRNNFGLLTQTSLNGMEKVNVINGDILDSLKLKKVLRDIDIIIHLAAKVSTPYSAETAHAYDQVNNWGTAEIVYAVENSNVKTFIHLSSTAVYGFGENSFDEISPLVPVNSYAVSKVRGEQHVQRLFKKNNIRTLILRSSNVFGFSSSMRFESVINKFVYDAKYSGKIYVDGDGEQIRPFINILDLVKVIEFCTFNNGAIKNGIYNVFSDNIKIIDIAKFMKSLYTSMDIKYLNQHIKYGSVLLKSNDYINRIYNNSEETIYDKVKTLSESLSF